MRGGTSNAEVKSPAGWSRGARAASTLNEFLASLHDLRRAGWLFRGEACWNDTRQSSLGRRIAVRQPSPEKYAANEADLINLFRSGALPHLQPSHMTLTTGVFGWLVLMQHHGAPTRLLDWSWSVWVAAYHAVCGCKGEDGYVWAFDTSVLSERSTPEQRAAGRRLMKAEEFPEWIAATLEAPRFVLSCGTVECTDRMVAQQGTFTMCNPPWIDHTEELAQSLPTESLHLLPVPASLKPALMQTLAEMNLSAASLYPGMDGIGRRVAEAMEWGQTVPHTDYSR